MEKILITGASGFIGGFLVEEALNRGLDVYAGIRKSSSKEFLSDPRINFCYMDFRDTDHLSDLLTTHQFDYVIHNAGLTQAKTEETLMEVNAEYLNNLLTAVTQSDNELKKFSFMSSLASYGPADFQPKGIVDHESVPNPVTKYGRSKLKGEEYLKSTKDIPWVILRPTAVYGPREHELLTVFKSINSGIEAKIGFAPQKLSFIYVYDLARITLDTLLQSDAGSEYFVGDGEIYEVTEFNRYIREALGKKTLKLSIPVPIMSGIALLYESISKVTGNYPIVNLDKMNEIKAKSWQIDTNNLLKDINFVPRFLLEDGIKDTVRWYKENNWI